MIWRSAWEPMVFVEIMNGNYPLSSPSTHPTVAIRHSHQKRKKPMHPWLMLAIAIAAELAATTALKLSAGFTRLTPSVVVAVGYLISFYMLSQVLKTQEVGIVYAIWSGAGLAIIALIGVFFLGESVSAFKVAGLLAIFAGVMLLNLAPTAQ
jgi:small multidrug resistance pump